MIHHYETIITKTFGANDIRKAVSMANSMFDVDEIVVISKDGFVDSEDYYIDYQSETLERLGNGGFFHSHTLGEMRRIRPCGEFVLRLTIVVHQ